MGGEAATALLGDIGGTNARFALLTHGEVVRVRRQPTADHPDPASAIRDYLRELDAPPALAVLAVAGPVAGGRARLTNAAWTFDTDDLAEALGMRRIVLVNDFAAQAWAVPDLAPGDLRRLGGDSPDAAAPKAVLGAGTGLGVAAYLPADAGAPERVVTGEGGHATLAAGDDEQAAVLDHLRRVHGRMSAERVLSGPGLAALSGALGAMRGDAVDSATPEAVLSAARAGQPTAGAAVRLFRRFLGAFAGDLALIYGARGGVYVSGGLARAMAEEIAHADFRAAFEAKGRFRDYVAAIPAWIVMHGDPAFLGLGRLADRERARAAGC